MFYNLGTENFGERKFEEGQLARPPLTATQGQAYFHIISEIAMFSTVTASKHGKNAFRYATVVLWNPFPDAFWVERYVVASYMTKIVIYLMHHISFTFANIFFKDILLGSQRLI